MSKKIVPFGLSETDKVVMTWLASRGIDPVRVAGYRINRPGSDMPTIELTMFYDESEAEKV